MEYISFALLMEIFSLMAQLRQASTTRVSYGIILLLMCSQMQSYWSGFNIYVHQLLGRDMIFGSMNVRSLSPLKLDALLVEQRDRSWDVMLLCETWHDADSISIHRLRFVGFGVIERERPR